MHARRSLAAMAVLLLALIALPLQAMAGKPDFWSTPTIHGYGKIHYVADGAYRPDPKATYRIVFALTKGAKAPDQVNGSLDHVARAVNLYVASGVPLDHLKFVAVASGPATPLVLDNAQYRAKFGVDNPNLALITQLRKAGVDVSVCAQAVAEHHFEYDWVAKDVSLSLSALTTVTTLQQQGYALEPL